MANNTNLVQKVEINCDMGEGFGKWKMGPDEELIKFIDVANITCGFHAGDPKIMLQTVRLAKKNGVKAGAHPGLQDLLGFGRGPMVIDPAKMFAMIIYQVGALRAILDFENVPVYRTKGLDNKKAIYDKPGLMFIKKAYIDILYTKEKKLVPISPDTMVSIEDIYKKTLSIGRSDTTTDKDGQDLKLGFSGAPFSICLHSDMPTALENAKACRKAVDELNANKFPTVG
ncbi:UPF0271 protein [Lachnellula occidentalis]|uniref:UPF0271 protein n=1 Tax=Lachnellula occidentalis TaxID=215460 RepID=A0A8H8S990_9HELO|nr:UPF0271 protein [Lachnellula occidentalis]